MSRPNTALPLTVREHQRAERSFAQSPVLGWSDAEIGEVKSAVLAKMALALGKDPSQATNRDWFAATALAIRDRITHLWLTGERENYAKGRKRVYYLSLEFLIG